MLTASHPTMSCSHDTANNIIPDWSGLFTKWAIWTRSAHAKSHEYVLAYVQSKERCACLVFLHMHDIVNIVTSTSPTVPIEINFDHIYNN